MKRVLMHCMAWVPLVACAIAVVSACAHDDSSIFVQNVIYPTPATQGQACIFSPNPTQTFLSQGVLDTAFRQEYNPEYLLANQLVTRANPQQLRTETSTMNIEGGIVRITDTSGAQLASYTTLTSGTVYPSTGGIPGYAVVGATAVDQATVQSVLSSKGALLRSGGTTTVVSYIKFFGHTLGGQYLESNEFEFPVVLCYGCLVTFSALDINEQCSLNNGGAPNCLGSSTSGGISSAAVLNPCVMGQDTPIDCNLCSGSPICRGVTTGCTSGVVFDGGLPDSGGDSAIPDAGGQ